MITWSTHTTGSHTLRFMRPKDASRLLLVIPGAPAADYIQLVEFNAFAREMYMRGYVVVVFDRDVSKPDASVLYSEYQELMQHNVVPNLPVYTMGGFVASELAALTSALSCAIISNCDMYETTDPVGDAASHAITIPMFIRYSQSDDSMSFTQLNNAMTNLKNSGITLTESEALPAPITIARFARSLDRLKATEIYNYLIGNQYVDSAKLLSIDGLDVQEVQQQTSLSVDDVGEADRQVRILNADHEFAADVYADLISAFALYGPTPNALLKLPDLVDDPAYLVRNVKDTLQVSDDELLNEEIVGAEFQRHNGTLTLSFNTGRELVITGFPSLHSIGIGTPGDDGIAGSSGADGTDGVAALEGPRGCPGLVGPTGPRGRRGPVGVRGPQGPVGPTGPRGMQGPRGPLGAGGNGGIHQAVVQRDDPGASVGAKGIWCQTGVTGYSYADVRAARGI